MTDSSIARGKRRVLIVGAGKVGRTLAKGMEAGGNCEVAGFVDDLPTDTPAEEAFYLRSLVSAWPLLGTRDETERLVRELAIDEVVVAYAPTWQQQLAQNLAHSDPGVQVRVVPSLYETSLRVQNLDSCHEIALMPLACQWSRANRAIKRGVDMTASLVGLVTLLPLALVLGGLIKASSRGPILFRQERIGRHDRPFIVYKFRTMIVDAEAATGPTLSSGPLDARLTRVGRWMRLCRLDELPQLWNVLKGEMSLIGPRPERPEFVERYALQTPSYRLRHQARPGITGLAQVHGGYHTDARDKLRFDLTYVSHGSLKMDAQIILRTLKIMVVPDVASHTAAPEPSDNGDAYALSHRETHFEARIPAVASARTPLELETATHQGRDAG